MDKFVHLTKVGWEKAVNLSKNWNQEFHKIYTSPLQRCVETILPLSLDRNVDYLIIDELQELDYRGNAQIFHEMVKTTPGFHFEDGETLESANQRFSNIVILLSKQNVGKSIILSTHGTVLSQFLIQRFKCDLDIFNSLQYPDIFKFHIDNLTEEVSGLVNIET